MCGLVDRYMLIYLVRHCYHTSGPPAGYNDDLLDDDDDDGK